jgi:predicted outer membrane repeat protein
MPDAWELAYGLDLADANDAGDDLDGDSFTNICEYLHGSEPDNLDNEPLMAITIHVPEQVHTVSGAISACIDGDRIILAVGTYREQVQFSGKAIHISSLDPNDSQVVASTVIDVNDRRLDVVTVNRKPTGVHSALVEGVTLTGGRCGIRIRNPWTPHNITFSKCRIVDNHGFGVLGYGNLRLENCVLARNGKRAMHIPRRRGVCEVINCTVVDNGRFGLVGRGIDRITNSIVWGHDNDLHRCGATYSCIQDPDAGKGNIHRDPLFRDVSNGDYHLQVTSPCVNAGDPTSHYSQEPGDGDGRVNMGAYGDTPEATVVHGGGVTACELTLSADHGSVTKQPDKESYTLGERVMLQVEPDAGYDFRMWSGDVMGVDNPMTVTMTGHMSITAHVTRPCYVSPYGDDAWDGSSATDEGNGHGPKKTIHAAIAQAGDGSVIKLAQGVYYENIDFFGKDILLTGFEPRDWDVVAGTVIRGDATGPVATFSAGEQTTVVLQGVTIQNSGGSHAGIHCGNAAGPLVRRCIIEGNQDGIRCDSTSPAVKHCIVRNNSGIGIVAGSLRPVIHNNIIHGNKTGITIEGLASISHCTVAGNGLGIDCGMTASPRITNCIVYAHPESSLWGNGVVTYSCIEGGFAGEGNLDADPRLTQDYHLALGSPCINRGMAGVDEGFDIDGQARVLGAGIDMGADEVEFDRLYVHGAAAPGGNGSSWSEAYGDLQEALAVAEPGDRIWVAQGTYRPTSTGDRGLSFQLKPEVALYGGFSGSEIRSDDRDWFVHPTILSGDIDAVGDLDSFHVVTGADQAILDGFIVAGGHANGVGVDARGGGVLNIAAAPVMRNCVIMGNRALEQGGGIYSEDCAFSLLLSSCNVIYNGAGSEGGGLYHRDANAVLTNCIVWGNTADTGLSVANSGASRAVASYCDIQGSGGSDNWDTDLGTDGGHNIDADPLFVDYDGADDVPGTLDDDYAPGSGSPCMSSGVRGQSMGAVAWDEVQFIGQVSVSDPVDLAVHEDRVYVLSSADHRVSVFDDQLNLQIAAFDRGVLVLDAMNPLGMCVDEAGRIYIADTGHHRILRYTPQGILDPDFAQAGILGTQGIAQGQFASPRALAVDSDGQVYIADSGNHRIQVYDGNGVFIGMWGRQGTEPGAFQSPGGLSLCETPESTLLIADTGNGRLQWVSGATGSVIDTFILTDAESGPFASPADVWYDPLREHVLVADTGNERIQMLEMRRGGMGLLEETIAWDLSVPASVAGTGAMGSQAILIADTGRHRVLQVRVAHDLPAQHPLYRVEEFKNTLRVHDIQTALSFIEEMSRENYEVILKGLQPHFDQVVQGMGPMELAYETENTALYEMLHDGGGGVISAFPVYFIKDRDGNWKIGKF